VSLATTRLLTEYALTALLSTTACNAILPTETAKLAQQAFTLIYRAHVKSALHSIVAWTVTRARARASAQTARQDTTQTPQAPVNSAKILLVA
jgi:hypothetical protein